MSKLLVMGVDETTIVSCPDCGNMCDNVSKNMTALCSSCGWRGKVVPKTAKERFLARHPSARLEFNGRISYTIAAHEGVAADSININHATIEQLLEVLEDMAWRDACKKAGVL